MRHTASWRDSAMDKLKEMLDRLVTSRPRRQELEENADTNQKKVVDSVVTSEGSCGHCDEINTWYLQEMEDGSIRIGYDGCGGYMGFSLERNGKEVDLDKAISSLENRIEELKEERRKLLQNMNSAKKMLARLLARTTS